MNHKSFVFSKSNDTHALVVPAAGRYHLYLNDEGQIEIINSKGEIIPQGSGDQTGITTVNGDSGPAVTLDATDVNSVDFISMKSGSFNGALRKSGQIEQGMDVYTLNGAPLVTPGFDPIHCIYDAGRWQIYDLGTTIYEADPGVESSPTAVTTWNPGNAGGTWPMPTFTNYTGTIQQVLERTASAPQQTYFNNTLASPIDERLYQTSTNSGGTWQVYATSDMTASGATTFINILGISATVVDAGGLTSIATVNVASTVTGEISGTATLHPEGDPATTSSFVYVSIKGVLN